MRKLIPAALFALWTTFAGAQPAPVPALPDTARIATYSITASTCGCALNFQLYGDGVDWDNWIEVRIGSTRYLSTDPSFGWVLTSPSGSIGAIARPIVDAVLTFNAVQTGQVTILGAQRPRRLSEFSENALLLLDRYRIDDANDPMAIFVSIVDKMSANQREVISRFESAIALAGVEFGRRTMIIGVQGLYG